MADEREFDQRLEEQLSGIPLPDAAVREITPWRRAMKRIVWGIGLTTVTLNFWNLDLVLPAAGWALLFLGFRTLRKENRWFGLCWVLSLCGLAAFFALCVENATIWSAAKVPLGAALLTGRLAQGFCLWRGIRAVRRAAGQDDRAGAVAALLIFQMILYALALFSGGSLRIQGLVPVAVSLILYICILRALARLPALLDGGGYVVRAAPARLSDRTAGIAWAVLLTAGVLLAGALLCRYPMEWTPAEAGEQQGLEGIRDNLLALGMPEQVVNDLAPEDLVLLDGALSVTTHVHEQPFNSGRRVVSRTEEGAFYRTVYDVKELRLSDIAVELPEGRWRIIHHFLWQEDPGPRTTECIKLWPSCRDSMGGWRQAGGLTGRLLYDWEGVTYTGDYYSISTETYTSDSIFWGETQNTDPFALFSLPRQGERCRGYLTYGMETVEEGWLIDSWCNYTHQVGWLNYPAMTAQEFDQSGAFSGATFRTSQTAIQFDPLSDSEKGSYRED